METNTQKQKELAEHLRLAVKELRWAAQNLAVIYEAMRTEDNKPIEDPNQLKMFEDEY